ncbi:MAG: hypothetical protein ABW133_12365 [Polyangiaceae bacterium]
MRTLRARFPVVCIAALAVTLAGCARRDEPPPPPPAPNPVVVMPPEPQVPTIVWRDPPKWQRLEGNSPMRKASYKVAAVEGDPEDAEVGVYYFGPTSGGSVEANIQRWTSQFPDVPASQTKRSERQANGMKQTIVEIEGTYDSSGMSVREPAKKPHFRMIAAVVETPAGSYFFKMTGPQKTVEAGRSAFLGMLDTVNKG